MKLNFLGVEFTRNTGQDVGRGRWRAKKRSSVWIWRWLKKVVTF